MLNTISGCANHHSYAFILTRSHDEFLKTLSGDMTMAFWLMTKRVYERVLYDTDIELTDQDRKDLQDLHWLSDQFQKMQYEVTYHKAKLKKESF